MRENLSSFLSAIQRTVRVSTDQHVYVCRSLQINIATCISSNPNNISRYFPLIGDEIVDREGLNYSGYIFSVFFHFFLGILRWVPNDALQNYKRFSYTGAPLSNTLWRRRVKKDVNKVHEKLQNHFHHHTELNYIYSLLTVLFFKLNCIEEIKS